MISDWVCSSKWRGLRAKFGNYRCGERRQTLALFVWIFCYQDQSDWCLFSSHPDFRSDVRLFWCNFGWASIVMGYVKQEWLLWNSTFEMILTSYTFYICCCYAHCMPFLIGAYPSCKLNCNLRIHIMGLLPAVIHDFSISIPLQNGLAMLSGWIPWYSLGISWVCQ